MDLRAGIIDTAKALGMDPIDLATIISYETGGTFNPTQAGPTTQWGQHRGLIQFGEPQAAEFGVDWKNPLGSQLGAEGAIAKYYRKNGWQPGMGMMDAYSIVNAGAPGRYGASDAGNGGAPGTVADKVNGQMGGHRTKAEALLGGAMTPNGNTLGFGAGVQGANPIADMFAMAGDPGALNMGTEVDNGLGDILAPKDARKAVQVAEQKKEDDRRQALFANVGSWFG